LSDGDDQATGTLMSIFRFEPRWKEELLCTATGGSFVLEFPMGSLSVYVPTEAVWKCDAPQWASDLWPALVADLRIWCVVNDAQLVIDDAAPVSGVASCDTRDSQSLD
jgi:hypothetical protein